MIETEDGEVLGVYVNGFVNRQFLVDTYNKLSGEVFVDNSTNLANFIAEDAKYMWCKSTINERWRRVFNF